MTVMAARHAPHLLLRPLAYLTIRHSTSVMELANWWWPCLLSAALVGIGAWLAPGANVFQPGGLVDKSLGFIQSLPGFYLAALAAVATFGRAELDQLMPGEPPVARIIYNNQLVAVQLTRRRFLCLMFSYLTALSFGITLAGLAAQFLAPYLAASVGSYHAPVKALGTFIYLAATLQMLSITLWGLYYLGERIHTPDN